MLRLIGSASRPLALVFVLFTLAACNASQSAAGSSAVSPSSPASPAAGATPSSQPSTQGQPSVKAVVFVFAPQPGSSVGGTVREAAAAGGITLTAALTGLAAGQSYLVDADPLPCTIFTLGPSQSFAKSVTADSAGDVTVAWTVPAGMAGSASIQSLTAQATYAVLACADLG